MNEQIVVTVTFTLPVDDRFDAEAHCAELEMRHSQGDIGLEDLMADSTSLEVEFTVEDVV